MRPLPGITVMAFLKAVQEWFEDESEDYQEWMGTVVEPQSDEVFTVRLTVRRDY